MLPAVRLAALRRRVAAFYRLYHSNLGVYGYKPTVHRTQPVLSDAEFEGRKEQPAAYRLVEAFWRHGHAVADYNPLSAPESVTTAELDPSMYGLSSGDRVSPVGLTYSRSDVHTVGQLLLHLQQVFCGHLSAQFTHVATSTEREWLARRLEAAALETVSDARRVRLAELLLRSQTLDRFLAVKFATVKRYGGEGAESLLAFISELLAVAAHNEIDQVALGMAHRGRLNLLTGLLQYPAVQLFQKMRGRSEFADDVVASGDVLSHINQSTDLQFDGRTLHVSLLSNPSHLEAVNPMVMGRVRGRQQSLGEGDYSTDPDSNVGDKTLCVQVHGDAALAGQGVIQEGLALSCLPHTRLGGSLHLVINNQLGFTTPQQRARSSPYCTDVAAAVLAPVLRVNADHPEAVVRACRVAFEYRQRFRKDVFVDLVCYRRWGHNELDDPTVTNPTMYRHIQHRVTVPDKYAASVVEDGLMTSQEVKHVQESCYAELNQQLKLVDTHTPQSNHLRGAWTGMTPASAAVSVWDTGVEQQMLQFLGAKSVQLPDTFNIHSNLSKWLVEPRLSRLRKGTGLDWATCESLALSSLLMLGYHVRLCGQDVGRGTFSQRHVMLVDQLSEQVHIPLNSLSDTQSGFLEVVNSALTEEAQLAFEYGVSIESPARLCIWEAQFGDFFNGAQIPIDTMVTSGEAKWLYQCGLVLLLPHGMDGAGPEHSSCRLERFLQLTDSREDAVDGDDVNLHVVVPSTPAQYFHVLRRQLVRPFRKPLLVVTPKMLLRSSAAVSGLGDLRPGTHWNPVIDDAGVDGSAVGTVLLCSGKHYYSLQEARSRLQRTTDVALVRLEQLTPFPVHQLNQIRDKYTAAKRFVWCQEEHRNQGAWTFVRPRFRQLVATQLEYCGRDVSATPASGIGRVHLAETRHITETPFLY